LQGKAENVTERMLRAFRETWMVFFIEPFVASHFFILIEIVLRLIMMMNRGLFKRWGKTDPNYATLGFLSDETLP